MGQLFSVQISGNERNYTAKLANYALTRTDRNDIDRLFGHSTTKIGDFVDEQHSADLQVLFHAFCYKHRLILNKHRFESLQQTFHAHLDMKYELGFNALWHLHNQRKIPLQVFKFEKSTKPKTRNSANTACSLHSEWFIYIALVAHSQRRVQLAQYLNAQYVGHGEHGVVDERVIEVLCSYLPPHHALNHSGSRVVKLAHFTASNAWTTTTTTAASTHHHADGGDMNGRLQRGDEGKHDLYDRIMSSICELVQDRQAFMRLIDVQTLRALQFDYDCGEHEVLQFLKYLLLFFYHKDVNQWMMANCNHCSRSKCMNDALKEVMSIWNRKNVAIRDHSNKLNALRAQNANVNSNHFRVKCP